MVSVELEMGITDALFRIKRDFERTNGNIYLSFSGGKDSTVVAELIKMADLMFEIPFVFANTGIELNATLEHVKNYDYGNVQFVKPRKPAVKVWKENGRPIKSKLKSEALQTHHNDIKNNEPLFSARGRQLISGEGEKKGVKTGKKTMYSLAKKDFHLLHEDLEYPIANKCCHYMKKMPFKDFTGFNRMRGTYTGVRSSEGGVRSAVYKSCVHFSKVSILKPEITLMIEGKEYPKTIEEYQSKRWVGIKEKVDYLTSMPIFDWTDEMIDEFIEVYNIKLSKAYTDYGMKRTGCMACPFSTDIEFDLKVIHDNEPNKYKASMKMLGQVYMDSGVECSWDEEYMKEYRERQKVNEIRRNEMLDKYSDLLENRKLLK